MRKAWLGFLLLLAAMEAAAGRPARAGHRPARQAGRRRRGRVLLPPGVQPPAPPRAHAHRQPGRADLRALHRSAAPGDQVVFHNSDRTRHHVYSFSAAKPSSSCSTRAELDAAAARPRRRGRGRLQHPRLDDHLPVRERGAWIARTGADGVASFSACPPAATACRPGTRACARARASLQEKVALARARPCSCPSSWCCCPDTRRQPDRERAQY
jgi:hypothetical protein